LIVRPDPARIIARTHVAAGQQPPTNFEAVTSGDFPHLAAALAVGGEVREPSFERLAAWTINGLVEQAIRAG